MDDVRVLSELQLDALREVANIGAAHAATALSQMTERPTMIAVPEIKVMRLGAVSSLVGDSHQVVVAVSMHMLGDLTGRILLMVPEDDTRLLCDLLLRRDRGTTIALEELEQSSFKETANIVGGAYLNALSDFLGMMLMPSVPSLVIDEVGSVFTSGHMKLGEADDFVLCVETEFRFRDDGDRLTGHLLLLPDTASLTAIFDAIRVT